MKNLIAVALLFLALSSAQAVFAKLPPRIVPTNSEPTTIALNSLAVRMQAMEINRSYYAGKVDRLEHEVDRMETMMLVLVGLMVIVAVASCMVMARNQGRAARTNDVVARQAQTAVRALGDPSNRSPGDVSKTG